MKVGDLVTLSEVAIGLAPLWKFRDRVRAGEVIGMVTGVREDSEALTHRYFKGAKYVVYWFDPKLQRRPLKRQAWMIDALWKRTDLKKYRPPKKK
tara:strand:+ start:66 stop:350 length:285 start_codon:yes stop_codon:yes gene_type:complete